MVRIKPPIQIDWLDIAKQMFKDNLKESESKKTKKPIACKICKTINEYLEKPNQEDGTHICYGCKK